MIGHTLGIWSQNVRATANVQREFLRWADVARVNIVAVQDTCDITGNPIIQTPDLPTEPTYTSVRKVNFQTKVQPQLAFRGYHLASEHGLSQRVCFYVRRDLAIKDWSCIVHNDLLSSLTIQTQNGVTHIHNIYNAGKKINMDLLESLLLQEGEHIFLGDWNLHDKWWGGKQAKNKACAKSRRLHHMFRYEYEMILLTPQESQT